MEKSERAAQAQKTLAIQMEEGDDGVEGTDEVLQEVEAEMDFTAAAAGAAAAGAGGGTELAGLRWTRRSNGRSSCRRPWRL